MLYKPELRVKQEVDISQAYSVRQMKRDGKQKRLRACVDGNLNK